MINKKGVYKIINKINSNFYIGSAASSFKKRWNVHKSNLNKNKHGNIHLQNAWNKYGADNFEFNIILLCDAQNCLYYEQLLLDKYFDNCKNCYNIEPAADSSFGRRCLPATKEKLSKANKGKNAVNKNVAHSIQTRNKISNAHKGKILTIEHKTKISNALSGRKHATQTKQKISDGNKGKSISIEHRQKLSILRLNSSLSNDTKVKIGKSLRGNKNSLGYKHSLETREKMRLAKLGKNNPNYKGDKNEN